jgi:peptidyl-prolyl cis-trans isomerase D
MLKILRENAQSWVIKFILLAVAVTFVSWGGSYLLREKKSSYAAMVNGVVIDPREYADAYQNMLRQYRDALGSSFNEKMIAELKLKEKLLDDFVNRILLTQEAKRLGLAIYDADLKEMIQSVPAFQVDGQFDPRQYERFLRTQRMSAEEFENLQRERMLVSRVVNLVRQNGVKISDQEVLETFLFENERLNLNFIKVSPEAFKGQVTANEIEIKDYYNKNQEEFRIPASVQLQYLSFRPSDFEGKVQVSPEEIKRAYESQKDRFKIPKQVRAREILIKANFQNPPAKVEERRKKAEEILEKAKTAKDFGSLAKQVSESNTASKGGELGWIRKGSLDEPSDAALFSMKPGETSGLVQRPDGFTLFRVEEVKEEKERSLEEVKEEVLKSIILQKAKVEASRLAEDAFYSLFRSRDLEKYSQEKNVPLKTTGFFKEGDEVPDFGRDPAFFASALSLKVGEISSVLNVAQNIYVLKSVNRKESRIPPLEEVKAEVTRKVVEKKAEEKAQQVADALLKSLHEGKDIRELARGQGLPVEETGYFTRTAGAIPKIGPVKESGRLLSGLTPKDPLPKEILKTREGYFVVRLLSVEPADQGRFAEAKKSLERRLLSQKQDEYFQNWLNELKSKAKIDINQDMFKSV